MDCKIFGEGIALGKKKVAVIVIKTIANISSVKRWFLLELAV